MLLCVFVLHILTMAGVKVGEVLCFLQECHILLLPADIMKSDNLILILKL